MRRARRRSCSSIRSTRACRIRTRPPAGATSPPAERMAPLHARRRRRPAPRHAAALHGRRLGRAGFHGHVGWPAGPAQLVGIEQRHSVFPGRDREVSPRTRSGGRIGGSSGLAVVWTPTPDPPPSTTSPTRCASGCSPRPARRGRGPARADPRARRPRGGAARRGDARRARRARRRAVVRARVRSSRCCATRRSTRSWSTAPGPVWVERAGGWSRPSVALRLRRRAAPRDRADPRAARAPRRRGRAAVRRPAAGRLARQRRDPAAGARRPGADDPPLPPARLQRRGPRRARHAGRRRCATSSRGRARAAEHPGQRRHRLGQDDDAQRAVVVRPGRRADRDDRGHRRAAPAPAPRRAARGAAAERRGPRRGDDPPARAQRAADAARPDRRRRGARARRRSTCWPR